MFVYCVCVLQIFRKKYTNTIYKVFRTPVWVITLEGSVLAPAAIEAIHSNQHVVSCSPTKLGGRLARGWCWRTGQASPHWWPIVFICIIPSCVLFLSLCHLPPYLFFFWETALIVTAVMGCGTGGWSTLLPETGDEAPFPHSLRGPVTLKDRQLCFSYQLSTLFPMQSEWPLISLK